MDIHFCRKSDYCKLALFLKENWDYKHILANDRAFFEWQHLGTDGREYDFVIAEDNDQVLGCLGFITTKRFDEGLTSVNTVWLTTWKVKNGVSGMLGLQLLLFVTSNVNYKFIGTVGNNETVKKIYSSLGYQTGELAHYFCVNKSLNDFKLANIPISVSPKKIQKDNFPTISKIYFGNLNLENTRFEVQNCNLFPLKSLKYFFNRYANHPIYNYNIYCMKLDEKVCGYVATRECCNSGRKVLRIVDILMFDKRGWWNLVIPFDDIMKKNNYEFVDFYVFGVPEKYLEMSGFIKMSERLVEKGTVIPNYFEPFEKKNIKISWAYRFSEHYSPIIFKGDCDQDRPNFSI